MKSSESGCTNKIKIPSINEIWNLLNWRLLFRLTDFSDKLKSAINREWFSGLRWNSSTHDNWSKFEQDTQLFRHKVGSGVSRRINVYVSSYSLPRFYYYTLFPCFTWWKSNKNNNWQSETKQKLFLTNKKQLSGHSLYRWLFSEYDYSGFFHYAVQDAQIQLCFKVLWIATNCVLNSIPALKMNFILRILVFFLDLPVIDDCDLLLGNNNSQRQTGVVWCGDAAAITRRSV